MAEFVAIGRFDSRLEAEAIGHALDPHGIPFLIQSPDVGVFGPGMVGSSHLGAILMVPSDRIDQVRELLDCVVRPAAEDGGERGPDQLEAAADEDPSSGRT